MIKEVSLFLFNPLDLFVTCDYGILYKVGELQTGPFRSSRDIGWLGAKGVQYFLTRRV